MKNKRFIAKCLTLAMVLALMIPTPVAAASSKGRLIKDVTEYSWNTTKNRWEKDDKVAYKYDKKAYPKEITTTEYSDYRFGIPFNATQTKEKAKYKYKGKKPKSMKLKNTAGKVTQTRKYKKGRVVSLSSSNTYSSTEYDDKGNYTGEVARVVKESTKVAYNKKGLAKSASGTSSVNKGGKYPYSSNENGTTVYTITHKKGVPSQIISSWTGSWYENDSGDIDQGTSKEPVLYYTKFNKKGLTIETGYVDVDSVTKAQTFIPGYKMVYKYKKGRVTQATVYDVDADWNTGVVTKQTPYEMYKFKYNKTKIGTVRYLSMINSTVGHHHAFFSWY